MNQIEPSECTITSLGAFSGLPSKASISTVIAPSCSVRVTRRVRCSQVTRRPYRSRVLPLLLFDGCRKTVTSPVTSLQHIIRSFGMSENSR